MENLLAAGYNWWYDNYELTLRTTTPSPSLVRRGVRTTGTARIPPPYQGGVGGGGVNRA